MASTWGLSWASAWGNSWGPLGQIVSAAKPRARKEYQSVSWDIDWQQPVIKEAEKIVPKETLVVLKETRTQAKPSKYLESLSALIEAQILELENSIQSLEEAESKVRLMDKYERIHMKLDTFIKKQKKLEYIPKYVDNTEDETLLLLTIYKNFF